MKRINLIKPIFVTVIIVATIITVNLFSQHSVKTMKSFFDNDYSEISKVYITNGSNGEIISITDKKTIRDISKFLSSLKLKKVSNDSSTGWSYRLSINNNDKEILNIIFNGEFFCKIKGSKYRIESSTNITIEELYNRAKENKIG